MKGENAFGSIDDDVFHSSLENSFDNQNNSSLDFEQAFKYRPNEISQDNENNNVKI